jgi:hypothetical protein
MSIILYKMVLNCRNLLIAGALIHRRDWSLFRINGKAVVSTVAKPTALGRFRLFNTGHALWKGKYAKINLTFLGGITDYFHVPISQPVCRCPGADVAG